MKVGILIDRICFGGIEKTAIEEVLWLKRLGIDARLLILKTQDLVPGAFEDLLEGLQVEYLDNGIPNFLRFSFKFPFFTFFSLFHITYPFIIPFWVRRKEYDLIVAHGTYTSFTSIGLRFFRGIPYAVFVWDPVTYIIDRVYKKGVFKWSWVLVSLIARLLDIFIINNSKAVITAGNCHMPYLRIAARDKVPIFKLYPGCDPEKYFPSKREDYILIVTTWKKGKDPNYLLEIMQFLQKAHLIVAGDWLDKSLKQDFLEKLHRFRLEGIITLKENLSQTALKELYKKARVLLVTNSEKGFGMPVLEAAACGCSFVIPDDCGVCEIFNNGEHGYFVKEKDTDKIVYFLDNLLNDKELAIKMGHSAWKVANENSWVNHAEKLADIIYNYDK